MHRTVASIVVLALWLSLSAMTQTRNTASTNKVKSFDHLVINVSDMERALAFYKRLGFTLINEDGWRKGQGQVSIKIGENEKINIHKQDVLGPQNKPQDIGLNDKFNLAYIPLAGDADFCLVWGGTIQQAQQHLRDRGVDHVSSPRNVTVWCSRWRMLNDSGIFRLAQVQRAFVSFFVNASRTCGGTNALTSPPSRAISLTMRELRKV